MTWGAMLWWLIVAHFVIDYPLQGDTTAREKNINSTTELQKLVPWYYWMTAHALMHGGAVALITGIPILGYSEALMHFLIDFGKCENAYNIHVDQMLHLLCKVAWLVLAFV